MYINYKLTNTPNNSQLIEDMKRGSEKAFRLLYELYSPALYSNILKLVKNVVETEEILQDVFIALWNKRMTIDPKQPIGGWLTVVSYNKSLTHLSKKVREKLLLLGEKTIELPDIPDISDAQITEQLMILNNAINELPIRKKEAFLLCKLQGKTYEEAGEIMGISTHTVREYIQIASQKVRLYVSDHYPSSSLPILLVTIMTA